MQKLRTMMKKITTLLVFITCFLVGLPGYAQEMPPGNVIVNTACLINEGHTFADAVDVRLRTSLRS
jgi:hypothetical protein